MPPPPLKLLKPHSDKEQQIEQLLIECGLTETLEAFRNEKSKRSRLPSADTQENGNFIEKKGDNWCCTFCDKTFTTKGSAKRHLVSTHSADSKQFECPRCSSKFARRDDLYTHLRRMHSAGQLVELMIEEHKAELKGEHKGIGKGKLMSVISHNEHLDVILPSGNTICRPLATDVSTAAAKEPVKAAKACRTAKCNHWRVMHDGHEDVLVNGALHHKNEEGEWECHGELGSLEDFEFLLSTAQHGAEDTMPNLMPVPDTPRSSCNNHHAHSHDGHSHAGDLGDHHSHGFAAHNEFSLDDFDFFLGPGEQQHHGGAMAAQHHAPQKQTIESLILPGGSVLCRRISAATPKHLAGWTEDHKHSATCGHNRVRHGNHYDFVVGNVIENEHGACVMHGASVLEQNDSATLSYVVSALAAEQEASNSAALLAASGATQQ